MPPEVTRGDIITVTSGLGGQAPHWQQALAEGSWQMGGFLSARKVHAGALPAKPILLLLLVALKCQYRCEGCVWGGGGGSPLVEKHCARLFSWVKLFREHAHQIAMHELY